MKKTEDWSRHFNEIKLTGIKGTVHCLGCAKEIPITEILIAPTVGVKILKKENYCSECYSDIAKKQQAEQDNKKMILKYEKEIETKNELINQIKGELKNE